MTASKTTRGAIKKPRSDDAHRIESHRVTASITRTEDGQLITEYQVAGHTVTDVDEVEAVLRGEAL